MGAFFIYILKSTVCLTLFYLFYKLLLSRDTFHRFNRIALLSLIVLSVLIPFCQLTVQEPILAQYPVIDLDSLWMLATLSIDENAMKTPLWAKLIVGGYFVGCLSFVCQFIYSARHILRIINQGKVKKTGKNIRLVVVDRSIHPFSWMNYIVISQKDLNESGSAILSHEWGHIKAYHSIDVLVTEICVIFHWFNPAAWLLKRELQHIHEYEADENVITQGIDAKKYQLLLIKKAVGSQRFTSMANSFNHSSLKKRIAMMLKRKSNPWARLKYFYVLPLAAMAVAAFARPEISRELEQISSIKISELVPVKEMIEAKSLSHSNDSIKIEPPVSVDISQVVEHIAEIDFSEFDFDFAIPNIEIEELQQKITQLQKQMDVDVQVEIEKVMGDMLTQQEINAIVSAELEKHQAEIAKAIALNQQEIDAIVAIELEKHKEEIEKAGRYVEEHKEEIKKAQTTTMNSDIENVLYYIDDIESTREYIHELDTAKIERIQIYKGEDAVSRYGEKASNGVVLVYTKK
ncbi:M56 family metallopeptidase [Parabacteroides sp. PF5-9]|uniref:M56 family metallopeptidase n=1 Tax=Parabacteroides sp. PF5-9 TaxID=1742404 RepID=UPI002475EF6F|nr:M56 family metallopeptidase [Parabacteroides sp. PF5-9]MDH6357842.1 hypothetical protein [Parabacteroides sp. PF5-9]